VTFGFACRSVFKRLGMVFLLHNDRDGSKRVQAEQNDQIGSDYIKERNGHGQNAGSGF
jgi:hypothetical protein